MPLHDIIVGSVVECVPVPAPQSCMDLPMPSIQLRLVSRVLNHGTELCGVDDSTGEEYSISSWPNVSITRAYSTVRNHNIVYKAEREIRPTPYPWAWGATPPSERTLEFVHSKMRVKIRMDNEVSYYIVCIHTTPSHPWHTASIESINSLHGEMVQGRCLDFAPYSTPGAFGYAFNCDWKNDLVCSLSRLNDADRGVLPTNVVWRDKNYAIECGKTLAEAAYAAAKACGVHLRQPQGNGCSDDRIMSRNMVSHA